MFVRSLRHMPPHKVYGANQVRQLSRRNPQATWIGRLMEARRSMRLHNFFAKEMEKDPGDVKGTKLKILKYPHPKLRTENSVIEVFDDNLTEKAKQMLLVMYAADGIGLAAPQVGINERLMVFNEKGDPSEKETEMVLVNPTILGKSEDTNFREEGCLSFPQINGDVERSITIDVEYQNLSGDKQVVSLKDLPARIFQHEYDHLDKVLFIDRFDERDQKLNQKRLDKYVKKYGPGGAP